MLRRTTSLVISLHLLFMMVLLLTQNRVHTPTPKHVHVRTLQIASAPPPKVSVSTPAPKKSPSPTKKISSTPKKPAPSPQPVKKVATVKQEKPAPPQKPPPPAAPNWNEIDQELAKIEKKAYTQEELTAPVLQISQVEPLKEAGDSVALLVGFFHEVLHLPEIGEVKVELTISKEGVVTRALVISSESEKNKQYLQTHLIDLKVPLGLEQEKTWTLTFSNEI